MTVSSTINKSGPYNGNGVTTAFEYEFRVLDETHLTVVKTVGGAETVLTLADFAVTGVGAQVGGSVVLDTPPAIGETITIVRNAPFTQQVDLENQGAYYAETVEQALDLAAMRDQMLAEGLSRTIQIPVSASPDELASLIADVVRLGDSADQIDTVAGIAGDVTAVAGIAGEVPTVAGISADVSTVAGIAPAVAAVAANTENINTVAGIEAEIIAVPAQVEAAQVAASAAEAAQVAAEAAAATVALPAITANTMLVDNADGTARQSKTFAQVKDLLGVTELYDRLGGGFVTPRDFVPTAGTGGDDTAAVALAMASDAPMYIDRPYRISASVTHTGSNNKRVYGRGHAQSLITMTNVTQDGLKKTVGSLITRDLGVTTSVDKSAGSAISTTGTSKDRVDNCMIYGGVGKMLFKGIDINGLMPNITFNYVLSCKNIGIALGNTAAGLGSEGVILGNTLNTAEAGNNANGIYWNSGLRTLRVFGNIIQNYAYGMQASPLTGYDPQSLIFANNTLEVNSVGGLALSLPAGSTTTLESVIVSGNQFNETTGRSIITQGATNLAWVKNLNINGNNFAYSSAGQVLLQAGGVVLIDGNVFRGTSAALVPVHLTAGAPSSTLFGINQTLFVTTLYALNGNTGAYKAAPIAAA